MNSVPINHATIRHPGVDSGIDLINSGVADTFGLGKGKNRSLAGHKQLFVLKDKVAVAFWQPGFWRDDEFWRPGWYCVRTNKLLLEDEFWREEAE